MSVLGQPCERGLRMLDIVLIPFLGRLHFKEYIQFRLKLTLTQ